jgi:hypothetical protein
MAVIASALWLGVDRMLPEGTGRLQTAGFDGIRIAIPAAVGGVLYLVGLRWLKITELNEIAARGFARVRAAVAR